MKAETEVKYHKGLNMYLNGISTTKISKELNISRSRFSNYLKEQGIIVNKLPHKKKINENINTEEKAYWLGFLYADGCISSGNRNDIELSLQLSDKEHLQKFKNFIGFEGKLITDTYRCRVSFKNRKMKSDLIKLGCTPRKSLTLTFPTKEQVPKELIPHFIRGYLDGDGCVICTEKTNNVNILGTKDMLQNICLHSGITTNRIYKSNAKSNKIFRLELNSRKDILHFCGYIYNNSKIYMERKFNKYKMLVEKFAVHN